METQRLICKKILASVVKEMIEYGYKADELDVTLSKYIAVDLDILHECISEIYSPQSIAA